ncbi:MAG: ribosomal-processing cysteine protease Prp [Saccharofermentanales bacterium]
MITIALERAPSGFIQKFSISGHSGYGESGSDIICAAISVLGQTAIGALQDLAILDVDYLIDEDKGFLSCKVPAPEDMASGQYQIANTIMDMFELGCRQVCESYGNKYVEIINSSFIE